MNWFTILLVYLLVWWTVLFAVLPFGVKLPEKIGKGHSAGAPDKPHLGIKAVVTTVLTTLITALFFWLTDGVLIGPHLGAE